MATSVPNTVTFSIDAHGIGSDAVTIDSLARLQLAARRISCRLVLRNAAPELLELVEFMGLAEILLVDRLGLGVEPGRQAEEREQRVGVEEKRELDDPAVGDLEHL
jgi:hypothetical protein